MLETILSAAGGGLFGLIGSGFTKFMGWKEKKLELEHAVKMATEDRLTMQMETELAKVKGAIDLELTESMNDAANLQAAISAESKITGTSQWVADLRGSLRPILTYSLVICAVVMAAAWPTNQWNNEILFLTTTAVTFWFGSRPISTK
jgi:hypothetical protein